MEAFCWSDEAGFGLGGDLTAPYSGTRGDPASLVPRSAASARAGWIEHSKSFFYVQAYSRRSKTLYDLNAEGHQVRRGQSATPARRVPQVSGYAVRPQRRHAGKAY